MLNVIIVSVVFMVGVKSSLLSENFAEVSIGLATLPRTLNEWQFCDYFSTSETKDATENTQSCVIQACPGDILVASLCKDDSEQIWMPGDSYLRLRNFTSSVELAANDDSCGLASRFVYEVTGSACDDYEIIEGCSSDSYCNGRVGVLLTSTVSSPTAQPTATSPSDTYIPRTLDSWLLCSNYFNKNPENSYSINNCVINLCPNDYFVISQCPGDFNQIDAPIGYANFDLIDLKTTQMLSKSDQVLSCDQGNAYYGKVSTDFMNCTDFTMQTSCSYGSCSGNQGIYISEAPIGRPVTKNIQDLSRVVNNWVFMESLSLLNSLNTISSTILEIELCEKDILTFSGCSKDDSNLSTIGGIQIATILENNEFSFLSYLNYGCDRSYDTTHLILYPGCHFYNVSVSCIGYTTEVSANGMYVYQPPGCSGNLGLYIEEKENTTTTPVIYTLDEWTTCGSFSKSAGGVVLQLCELTVCPGDEVRISFCNGDNPDFYINAAGDISLAINYQVDYSYTNRINPSSYEINSTTGCGNYVFSNFANTCSYYGIDISSSSSFEGIMGLKHVSTGAPTLMPTYAPLVHTYLPRSLNNWLFCDPFNSHDTSSAMTDSSTCMIELCEGDQLLATLCSSENEQATCAGDSFLRLIGFNSSTIALNDDTCDRCSQIEYFVNASSSIIQEGGGGCQNYTLMEGCWDSESCSGKVAVYITHPTFQPTSLPTSPTYIPTMRPTSSIRKTLPYKTDEWLFCEAFTIENSNTTTTSSSVECVVQVCPGNIVTASLCSSTTNMTAYCNGDTILQFANSAGEIVSSNDDFCGTCSEFMYSFYPSAGGGGGGDVCANFTIIESCYQGSSCDGVLGVFISSNHSYSPTILPSSIPSYIPTIQSTSLAPSFLKTNQPTAASTKNPTIKPTSLSPTRDAPTMKPSVVPSFTPTAAITQIQGSFSLNNLNLNNMTSQEVAVLQLSLKESIANTTNVGVTAVKNVTLTQGGGGGSRRSLMNELRADIDITTSSASVLVSFIVAELSTELQESLTSSTQSSGGVSCLSSASNSGLTDLFLSLLSCGGGTNLLTQLTSSVAENVVKMNVVGSSLLQSVQSSSISSMVVVDGTPTASPTRSPAAADDSSSSVDILLIIVIVVPVGVVILLMMFCYYRYSSSRSSSKQSYHNHGNHRGKSTEYEIVSFENEYPSENSFAERNTNQSKNNKNKNYQVTNNSEFTEIQF